MDSRVKQSKIILKNYFIFFPGKYISLSTRKIFSWILLSNIRKKKSKNDELSVKISLLLIMLPRRSFRERERGIHRYNDVIWRSKYRNYTISFLTTRKFKESNLQRSYHRSNRYIYSKPRLSFYYSYFFTFVSINSIDFQETHENQLSDSSLIRTAFSNEIQMNTKLFIVAKSIDRWRPRSRPEKVTNWINFE